MSDLIDRDALMKEFRTFVRRSNYSFVPDPTWNDAVSLVGSMPSAEPERKNGKWIEVYGYATPGGDPVWKCSECGKGIHVYGIEAPSYNRDYTDGHQWVACPNCGAEMTRGE